MMLQIWRADMAALLPALALAGLAAVTAEHRLQCSSLPSFDNSDVGCYKLNIFAAVKYFCVVRSCTSTSGACARRAASSWAACSASRSSHTSSATRSGTRVWWDEIPVISTISTIVCIFRWWTSGTAWACPCCWTRSCSTGGGPPSSDLTSASSRSTWTMSSRCGAEL